ncbi:MULTISPECIES: CarD family transcriptional regulator [Subtercola]|uniref:CarD family transcriptional regulator n=1 Tax=Subtercola vilae TaxID=2056433 RepID=A0A4T2CA02_9MICO|nr:MULTISPECIES: CarD family transcriptional regulator [Subtercola]MEA9985444.1 CarD family transcriptional regulator [Subtercola sp. RTI3]TIH39328.1 CarD family transcriptional regulator [Subtercola vilae]
MNFEVGETLVYPHHGAVTITHVETRTIKGVEKTYLTMSVHTSELTIKLPVDNIDLVGVRDVIDDAGVEAVYDVLRNPFVEEPGNWSRRYKANQEKMASGSVFRVGEVVRDLWRRDVERGVSAGEKRMLLKARQILVSELALAQSMTDEEASAALDAVLATVTVGVEANTTA